MHPIEHHTTRERLLEAAGEIFAEHGFRNTTVRDICSAARANVAAVNYHFGDKMGLYEAVVMYANDWALKKYPLLLEGEDFAGKTPQDRLSHFIYVFMMRFLDPGRPSWHGQLMSREMADPTEVLDRLVISMVRPTLEVVMTILRELMGAEVDETSVRMCAFSVIGQCIFYHHGKPMHCRMNFFDYTDPETPKRIAAHITLFTLGAVEHIRQETRKANA